MSKMISELFREYKLIGSLKLTIFGVIILFFGIMGTWFQDILISSIGLNEDILSWFPYLIILGFIVFGIGVIYLYGYLKDKKFIDEAFKLNKRSEFQKKHLKLTKTVKKMPKKYTDMLHKKEEEFHLK